MKHLDLFSGMGGFTLAAQWAGLETVAHCEINSWCVENALELNWPNIDNLLDVTKLCRDTKPEEKGVALGTQEFLQHYGEIDVLTASPPCQPASIIGKRKGLEDSRWLWPDTLRVVSELKPKWVVCENPTGILSLDRGDRFSEILEGFQQAGYSVWWETIPASAVGGGHRRERVWIVAYASGEGLEGHPRLCDNRNESRRDDPETIGRPAPKIVFPLRDTDRWWEDQSPVPVVVNGVSSPSFWKQAVIATGNAIVPQVAFQILRNLHD